MELLLIFSKNGRLASSMSSISASMILFIVVAKCSRVDEPILIMCSRDCKLSFTFWILVHTDKKWIFLLYLSIQLRNTC